MAEKAFNSPKTKENQPKRSFLEVAIEDARKTATLESPKFDRASPVTAKSDNDAYFNKDVVVYPQSFFTYEYEEKQRIEVIKQIDDILKTFLWNKNIRDTNSLQDLLWDAIAAMQFEELIKPHKLLYTPNSNCFLIRAYDILEFSGKKSETLSYAYDHFMQINDQLDNPRLPRDIDLLSQLGIRASLPRNIVPPGKWWNVHIDVDRWHDGFHTVNNVNRECFRYDVTITIAEWKEGDWDEKVGDSDDFKKVMQFKFSHIKDNARSLDWWRVLHFFYAYTLFEIFYRFNRTFALNTDSVETWFNNPVIQLIGRSCLERYAHAMAMRGNWKTPTYVTSTCVFSYLGC